MEERLVFYAIVVAAVFLCSASQLLLKKSADSKHKTLISNILNWRVVLAYFILFLSILVNITALRNGVNLKDIPILEAFGYVFVPLLSVWILHEKMTRQTVIATILIILGIVVFYI